jgi:hypothetical protein
MATIATKEIDIINVQKATSFIPAPPIYEFLKASMIVYHILEYCLFNYIKTADYELPKSAV